MTGRGSGTGSVEYESRLLAEALRRARPGAPADTPAPVAEPPVCTDPIPPLRLVGGGHMAEGDQTHDPKESACTSCPWCRTEAWRRAHGPTLLRGMADVAALAADGLTALAASWESAGSTASTDGTGSAANTAQTESARDTDAEAGTKAGTPGQGEGRSGNLPPSSPLTGDAHDFGLDERQERA